MRWAEHAVRILEMKRNINFLLENVDERDRL